jgi:L-lactate dehydrogenase complex protein LldG
MIQGKEEFLAHVSRCLGRSDVPPAPTPFTLPHDVQYRTLADASAVELAEIFTRNAEANGTVVKRCAGPGGLADTIEEALRELGAERLVLAHEEYFVAHGIVEALTERFPESWLWESARGRDANITAAERADAGVSLAVRGMAESGTTLLLGQGGEGRSVSLLPRYSVIVLRIRDIRPRLTQGMEYLRELGGALPANAVFISGASSTADIELVPVKGVHGPLKLVYVLVEA